MALKDRLVTGDDMVRLRESTEVRTLDLHWMMGMHNSGYSKLVSKDMIRNPISNPSVAILVRLLSERPELCPVPPALSPFDLYERVRAIEGFEDFPKRGLAILLGCEIGSPYRWQSGQGTSAIVDRLVQILVNELDSQTPAGRARFMKFFMKIVHQEAAARGIDKDDLKTSGFTRRPFFDTLESLGIDKTLYQTTATKDDE